MSFNLFKSVLKHNWNDVSDTAALGIFSISINYSMEFIIHDIYVYIYIYIYLYVFVYLYLSISISLYLQSKFPMNFLVQHKYEIFKNSFARRDWDTDGNTRTHIHTDSHSHIYTQSHLPPPFPYTTHTLPQLNT